MIKKFCSSLLFVLFYVRGPSLSQQKTADCVTSYPSARPSSTLPVSFRFSNSSYLLWCSD